VDSVHSIVAAANAWIRGVLPWAAALLDVMAISDVVKIVDAKTYPRPVHAGAALVKLRIDEPVQILSVRSSAFEAPSPQGRPPAVLPSTKIPTRRSTSQRSGSGANEHAGTRLQ
jgi:electron transfer flavoprotein alpha subunit